MTAISETPAAPTTEHTLFDTVRSHATAIGDAVREDYRNMAEESGRLRAGWHAARLALTGVGTSIYLVGHESLMGTAATSGYAAAESLRPGYGFIGAALGGAAVSAIAEFGLTETIPPVLAKAPRTAEVIEEQRYGTTDQSAIAQAANKAAVGLLAGSPGNIIQSYARDPKAAPEVHKRVGRRTAGALTTLNLGIWGAYGATLAMMPNKITTTVTEYAEKPYVWLGLIGGLYAVGKTATFAKNTARAIGEERERRRPEMRYDPGAGVSNTIGEPLLPAEEEIPAGPTTLALAFAASEAREAAKAAQRIADAEAAVARKHAVNAALQDEQWLSPARLVAYMEARPVAQAAVVKAHAARSALQDEQWLNFDALANYPEAKSAAQSQERAEPAQPVRTVVAPHTHHGLPQRKPATVQG